MKVLLVEDDASLREGMGEIISDLADVRTAGTEAEAEEVLSSERFDLVMTDLRIAGHEKGGRTVLEGARRRQQAVAIVSAASHQEVERALRPHAPDAVLAKPFQLEEITGLVERFLDLRRQVESEAAVPAPGEPWREVAPGVSVAPSLEGASAWIRMAPGSALSWRVHPHGGEGVLLLEGDLEVDGATHTGPRYLFLSTGQPPETRSRTGCLAVSVPLRGSGG